MRTKPLLVVSNRLLLLPKFSFRLHIHISVKIKIVNVPVNSVILAADGMMPLTLFLVLRAAVPHLGAELALLDDLTRGTNFQFEMNGITGYCYTTLKVKINCLIKYNFSTAHTIFYIFLGCLRAYHRCAFKQVVIWRVKNYISL